MSFLYRGYVLGVLWHKQEALVLPTTIKAVIRHRNLEQVFQKLKESLFLRRFSCYQINTSTNAKS